MSQKRMSAIQGILRENCPRCRQGRIFRCSLFRGWFAMHDHCPVCNLKFEREQGYFVGAMYVSYGLSIPVASLLMLLIWNLTAWSLERVLVAGFLAYLPFVPLMIRLSRVVWMYLDRVIEPD